MSYNPAIDAPRNAEQLEICVNYFAAIEQQKAAENPDYTPKTREELVSLYSIFIQPAPEPEPEPTTEQLFNQLRSIREVKLREYDEKIAQLERRDRIGEDVSGQLAAWDAYAVALCQLPEQDGAPWDGGGVLTPWPEMPA